jgi:hypothetical protein
MTQHLEWTDDSHGNSHAKNTRIVQGKKQPETSAAALERAARKPCPGCGGPRYGGGVSLDTGER